MHLPSSATDVVVRWTNESWNATAQKIMKEAIHSDPSKRHADKGIVERRKRKASAYEVGSQLRVRLAPKSNSRHFGDLRMYGARSG